MTRTEIKGQPGTPESMPLITTLRREHLLRYINLSSRGLEIGPYSHPTVFKSEADISYLDWKTREQLVAETPNDPDVELTVETDFLVTSNNYRESVPGSFDYIIANHVLEHVPNFVQWLSDIEAMLNPNGILYLALPDKKFTFDKYRPSTRLSHVLAEFYDGVQTISTDHFLEAEIFYDLAFIHQPMLVSERLDRARLERMLARGPHIGYHCHIFQSETVLDMIFKPLIVMGYLGFDIVEFIPAKAEHGGEMTLILRRATPGIGEYAVDQSIFYREDFLPEELRRLVRQLEQRINGLLQSRSYRITRPLRDAAARLRQLAGRK